MPRVIEIDPNQERKVTHRECGAVVGYFKNEIQEGGTHEDYGGGKEKWWYITCPHCGQKIEILYRR